MGRPPTHRPATASRRCAMTSNPIQPDELLAWLSASCQRQDLPLLINDPATVSKVAVLLGVRTTAE